VALPGPVSCRSSSCLPHHHLPPSRCGDCGTGRCQKRHGNAQVQGQAASSRYGGPVALPGRGRI
jgi:hypothetical protein